MNFSLFCWNIANPSLQRAGQQAEWLRARPEDVLILTEAKNSEGCSLLRRYFETYGYTVAFPKPEGKEFGVMLVSKRPLLPADLVVKVDYLTSRVATSKLNIASRVLHIIGVYVPSRDASLEKINRKRIFLRNLATALQRNGSVHNLILCGDLNVLEPNHIPHYAFFKEWEYDFYNKLAALPLGDTFRLLHPEAKEYSWIGRTGDGYRYDHCLASSDLVPSLTKCYYLHEPREAKLSDHSALITVFEIE